ncbi:hypothetical protein ENUP19_0083G0054 [Entamoeba nuttalli]|uniref:protein-tyrosine-phosphatase n=2 Tax=Entamoeba nuttalli TaxID=412467 RepID=K2GYP7_ENTNP|nr:dual specificity protein phosphatase, putative [Entamoeba nuttalli P19]EKE38967.1 dual specificity protein phosphatase, putative [Entamoeba nuttalli P19]|eukprot:XP_008858704.1 dual specificity protein phosphatase, putative [Entamoeba nuttalli P19]
MSIEGYTNHDCAAIYPEKLYLGTVAVANDISILHKLNIKNIVNATGYLRGGYDNTTEQYPDAFPNEINYLHLHINDQENFQITNYFQSCFDFIDHAFSQNEKVLVHCQAGISRSATLVIAYLIYHEKISLKDAYSKVYQVKKNIAPNKGFWKQLEDFEIKYFEYSKSSYPLVEYLTDRLYPMLSEQHSRDLIKEKLIATNCDISMTVALLLYN